MLSQCPGNPIAVTGLGAVCAAGRGIDALWRAVESGEDGMRSITRFSVAPFSVHIAAHVPDLPIEDPADHRFGIRIGLDLALSAAREAWDHAAVDRAGIPRHRIALVLGASTLERGSTRGGTGLHTLVEALGDALSIRGPRLTVSTACASSANAISLARDLLQAGLSDLVLAGGVCALTASNFAGFHALGVLSPQKCAPFSEPPGATLGEGAGFLVLERIDPARARGASILARLLGTGLSADAYHPTTPEPRGAGVARAIGAALADAGLPPEAVEYVNAHGTGTATSDPAEWRAIQTAFGQQAARLPVSSSKSILGHTQDAGGALEAIVTLLAMRRGVLPQTLHYTRPRPNSPPDAVGQRRPRAHAYSCAVCTSSAFGGSNAALVLGGGDDPASPEPGRACDLEAANAPHDERGDVHAPHDERGDAHAPHDERGDVHAPHDERGDVHAPHDDAARACRPIRVLGVGAVGPHGLTLTQLESALQAGVPTGERVPWFDIAALVPTADPRGLDPAARFLTAATAGALADAGVRISGRLRERAGLIVGITRASAACADEFWGSIDQGGLARVSARAFAHMVLNAPGGACARLLSLKGPHSAVSVGEGSGLAAVIYAALLLSRRDDADLLVAGGVDERPENDPVQRGEGAACVVLGPGADADARADLMPGSGAPAPTGVRLDPAGARDARPDRPEVHLAGWGLAGPDDLSSAIQRTLTDARVRPDEVQAIFGADPDAHLPLGDPDRWRPRIDPAIVLGRGEASASIMAFVAATLALRSGTFETALVTAGSSRSASCAVLLATRPPGTPR
jgi:3-oxoacyl-[acyl-carrier-protein] synthase II